MKSILDYLRQGQEKIATQLDIEFGYTVANYNFEVGTPRENALKHFFRSYFPERYAFTSGYLIDNDGNKSSQCDWIIYDSIYFAPIIAKSIKEDMVEFIPFDSAYAVVEVKSTLTEKTLNDAIKQLQITKKLNRNTTSPLNVNPLLDLTPVVDNKDKKFQQIQCNIFNAGIYAYSEQDFPNSSDIIDKLQQFDDFSTLPDFIAVHGKYYITKVQNYSAPNKTNNEFRFTHLPQQFNGYGAIESGKLTSAVFAIRLLNQLNNTSLNAHDYNSKIGEIADSYEITNGCLHKNQRQTVYDQPI